MLIVTHNNAIKNMVHKVIILKDGLIKRIITTKRLYLPLSWRICNMNKVLSKRIPREFKSNLPKYIALLLLIVLCMYLVTAMVASSETIIIRTDEHNAANHVEDGQFTTFLPLTDEQEKDITDKGVILERMYSLDIKAEDGSTLRVMKNRKNIDLVELISGEYPSKDNEAVVERRYAEEHSLDVGSKLTVGGTGIPYAA